MSVPVLVTGASGSLGGVLLDVLAERGTSVRGLVHRRPVRGAAEHVPGDLTDPASLRRAVAGAGAVLHLAACTHTRRAEEYMEVNLRGTERLLEAAAAAGIDRFVLASTRAVSEQGGAYSSSKLLAERAVERLAPEPVIVRLPEVYGAGGTEGIDRILSLARRGRPIPVVGRGDHELRPMHVEDAAHALAGALLAPPGVYTLGGSATTVRSFAQSCVAVAGSDSSIRSVPEPAVALLGQLGRVLPLPVFPDQLARLRAPKPAPTPGAESALGFSIRSLEDGLDEAGEN